ncbi:MAG TPA: polysaccharide pyruvyl transferase family protein [Gemmatimonadales bacterium]|nr:polysaccharide pyruvyl transferase family protein [Gemmatimonadales bacterium]
MSTAAIPRADSTHAGSGEPGAPTIGYLYPSGWGNLGDEAIQQSAVAAFRTVWPDSRIRAFTMNPAATAANHGIAAEPITGVSHRYNYIRFDDVPAALRALASAVDRVQRPWTLHRLLRHIETGVRIVVMEARSVARAWRWLADAGLFVAAGGGQLDDSWGGAWGHPYALARWAWLARRRRVPFVMLSVGFGQAASWLSRAFLRYAVNRSHYCSLREEASRELVRDLGVRVPLSVVPDLAFALRKAPGDLPAAPPLRIGLSPMAFRHYRWPDADTRRYQGFVDLWVGLVKDRVARGDRVHLYTTNPMDEAVVDDIWSRLDPLVLAGCRREHLSTVQELLSLYARVHLVVGTRLHAVLLALVAERPPVALSYERKVRTLMRDARLLPYCIDLEGAAVDQVSAAIDAVAEHRDQLQSAVARVVADWRGQVERQNGLLAGMLTARA